MEINLDSLRKRLIADYNSLVDKLNMEKDDCGEIHIAAFELSKIMRDLHTGFALLAAMYDEEGEIQPLEDVIILPFLS